MDCKIKTVPLETFKHLIGKTKAQADMLTGFIVRDVTNMTTDFMDEPFNYHRVNVRTEEGRIVEIIAI